MVKVVPAACCILGLQWELVFESMSIEDVVSSAEAIGFVDQSRTPTILSFHNPSGDKIVIVPKTGRIQLRLDLATEKSERPKRAEAIARRIAIGQAKNNTN